jgi:hypothetical protein
MPFIFKQKKGDDKSHPPLHLIYPLISAPLTLPHPKKHALT